MGYPHMMRRAIAAGGPVLPTFFAHAWEADDLEGVVSDGGAVSSWAAAAGAVALAQGGAATPIYRSTAAGSGLPSVEFVTTDYMDATLGTIAQPATYVFVFERDAISGVATALFDYTTARHHLWVETTGDWFMYNTANADTGFDPDGADQLEFHVAQFNGAASFHQVNGTKGAAVNPGVGSATGDFRVGANTAAAGGIAMYLHGVYIATSALTDAQIATARTYCTAKWGSP